MKSDYLKISDLMILDKFEPPRYKGYVDEEISKVFDYIVALRRTISNLKKVIQDVGI